MSFAMFPIVFDSNHRQTTQNWISLYNQSFFTRNDGYFFPLEHPVPYFLWPLLLLGFAQIVPPTRYSALFLDTYVTRATLSSLLELVRLLCMTETADWIERSAPSNEIRHRII